MKLLNKTSKAHLGESFQRISDFSLISKADMATERAVGTELGKCQLPLRIKSFTSLSPKLETL
ncbi:hypothetical protein MA16_Dca000729 [Dendrobium catenatum]|uniref:Uncharacterized protein n=1 Tax=Dendrobium catenatum TaxID=906689 RepID=A0A2I0WUP4_9ASPA|nr:hypothetical protein MA16_Dca000729 [Dendrobium catenatum]